MNPRLLIICIFLGLAACSSPTKAPSITYQSYWQTDIKGNDLNLLEAMSITPKGDAVWLAGQVVEQRKLHNWVAKIDSSGHILMQRAWVDSLKVVWNSIQPFSDKELLLTGEMVGKSEAESVVMKTDTAGQILWRKDWSHISLHRSLMLNDTSALLLGHTTDDSVKHNNYWLCQLDSAGNIQWEETWGHDQSNESFHQALRCASGEIIALGQTSILGQKKKGNAFVCKLSAKGDVLWEKTYGGEEDDVFSSVVELPDGNLVLMGRTRSKGAGKTDVWLVGINAQGEQLWENTLGGQFEDWGAGLALADNGQHLVLAAKYDINGEGLSDVWLAITDLKGQLVGESKWDIGNFDAAMMLLPSANKKRFWLLATGTLAAENQAITRLYMVGQP